MIPGSRKASAISPFLRERALRYQRRVVNFVPVMCATSLECEIGDAAGACLLRPPLMNALHSDSSGPACICGVIVPHQFVQPEAIKAVQVFLPCGIVCNITCAIYKQRKPFIHIGV